MTTKRAEPNQDHRQLLSRLGRGAAIVGLIRIIAIGLTFLFFLSLARATTPEVFGQFSAAYSLATILGYLANVGQHVSILRFWPPLEEAHGPAVASNVVWRGLILTSLAGIVIAALLFASGSAGIFPGLFVNGDAAWLLTGTLVLGMALSEFLASALRARGSVIFAFVPRDIVWRVAVIAALPLFVIPIQLHHALLLVSLTLALTCLPQLAVLIEEVWRYRGTRLPQPERLKIRRATPGIWASSSIRPLTDHAATVIVAMVLGPTAAGAYFAADRLAKLLSLGLVGIEQVSGPIFARSFHAGRFDEVRAAQSLATLIALSIAVLGAAAYIVLGKFALSLFAPAYVEALPALLILAAGQVISAACGSNAMLLSMAGREHDLLVIRALWGTLSIPAMFLAASSYGIIGAATASAIVLAGSSISAAAVSRWRFQMSGQISWATIRQAMPWPGKNPE